MATVRDIIGQALLRLRIVAPGESVSADIADQALTQLNDMLAGWASSSVTILPAAYALADQFRFFVPANDLGGNTIGDLDYQGTWNAATDIPALSLAVGQRGDVYLVAVAGDTPLGALRPWAVGDMIVSNGLSWVKGLPSSRFNSAVRDLLALEIATSFGREPMPSVVQGASEGWSRILAAFVQPSTIVFDAALVYLPGRRQTTVSRGTNSDPNFDFDGGSARG